MQKELRVAAYAVCVRDGRVLLARWVSRTDGEKRWTLPGGGMHHGEDPHATVIREVEEETGYAVVPAVLLGVDSVLRTYPRPLGATADFHGLRIVYEGHVTGGTLRPEIDGSTDLAAWHPLDEVPALDRVGLVDVGMALWRDRPADGRVTAARTARATGGGPAAGPGPTAPTMPAPTMPAPRAAPKDVCRPRPAE